jgi:Phage integrase, N-terminal SAM-like domain
VYHVPAAWESIPPIDGSRFPFKTGQSHVGWLRSFYSYVHPLPPDSLNESHVKDHLSYIATIRRVAKAARNLAFNALQFFYRHVFDKDIGSLAGVVRVRRCANLTGTVYED